MDLPDPPGVVARHRWGFEDPAKVQGAEDEVLEGFRRVRDQSASVFEAYVAGIKLAAMRDQKT